MLRSLKKIISADGSAIELPLAAFVLAACTALPSRLAIAAVQSAGIRRALYIGGGLLGDLGTVAPLLLVALGGISWFARRHKQRARMNMALLGLFVALASMLLAQNAATEFRFERGVFPGAIDFREGLGHHDLFTAELPMLLAGRFLIVNTICVAIMLLVLWRLQTRLLLKPKKRGLVLAVATSIGLLIGSQHANAYCETLHNPNAVAAPSAALVSGLVHSRSYDGSPAQIRRLLANHVASPADIAKGARQMGFPPESADRLSRVTSSAACSAPHPLERPLDDGSADPELLRSARALSRELFDGKAAPIVFHVSMESQRADDLRTVNEHAPTELAPFLSEVYARPDNAAAFGSAHQSGMRTSHAIAAVMCGMGALPFNLSMSRDLGSLPMRCMPDVLTDAGFRAKAFYGHDFVFDDMATFLRAHHVGLYERESFDDRAPRGVWTGVSDGPVYDAAIADSANASTPGAPQYNFVLTLSHHSPYTPPEDLAPEHRQTIDALCEARGIHGENCNRLKTLRYADESLRKFIARVESSKDAARTIIVVAGDHTVHQWVPWQEPEPAKAVTQIPVFVWLPKALVQHAGNQAQLDSAWKQFQKLAETQPISSSDVPALILALVGKSAPLEALPAKARWHTLGGQATSPHYRSWTTEQGVVHGINAHGKLFDVSESGVVRPTSIQMELLTGADDIAHAADHNRPEVAFWGSFLRGYAAHCSTH